MYGAQVSLACPAALTDSTPAVVSSCPHTCTGGSGRPSRGAFRTRLVSSGDAPPLTLFSNNFVACISCKSPGAGKKFQSVTFDVHHLTCRAGCLQASSAFARHDQSHTENGAAAVQSAKQARHTVGNCRAFGPLAGPPAPTQQGSPAAHLNICPAWPGGPSSDRTKVLGFP